MLGSQLSANAANHCLDLFWRQGWLDHRKRSVAELHGLVGCMQPARPCIRRHFEHLANAVSEAKAQFDSTSGDDLA